MLVIFDYGGTLIRNIRPEREILIEVLTELASERDVDPKLLIKAYDDVFKPYERRRNEYHIEVFSRTLRRGFLRRVVDVDEEEIRKAHARLIEVRQRNTEPYEDVLDTLKALREKNVKIGLLSNATYHDAVIASLDYHNLLEYIDYPHTSASLGVRKPHPRAFILAAKLSGFEPSEAVMVGNDPYKDYLGAINAGLKAILIDRSGETKGKNIVNDLREIVSFL